MRFDSDGLFWIDEPAPEKVRKIKEVVNIPRDQPIKSKFKKSGMRAKLIVSTLKA